MIVEVYGPLRDVSCLGPKSGENRPLHNWKQNKEEKSNEKNQAIARRRVSEGIAGKGYITHLKRFDLTLSVYYMHPPHAAEFLQNK